MEIEVDLSRGIPAFSIVGLPGVAIRESRERVRAALQNTGFEFPLRRITVNLAPAELRKEGTAFDLSIALCILAAHGCIPAGTLREMMVVGELALDGSVRSVPGVLPAALEAKRRGLKSVLVPSENKEEALVAGIEVAAASSLLQAVEHVKNPAGAESPCSPPDTVERNDDYFGDYADIRGLPMVLRALEVAAAGRHNILLLGPPGSGKTMLARRFPSILPPLTTAEAMEVTEIHSVARLLDNRRAFMDRPPFRSPHASTTQAAMTGGGSPLRPGEVTLAHRGVLFLDEFAEFPRNTRESLRAPMTDGRVSVSRASYSVTLPADFQLIAAANPCPCGYLGDTRRGCSCPAHRRDNYRSRLSGPIADRIDMHIYVPRTPASRLSSGKSTTTSSAMASRIRTARLRQAERRDRTGVPVNGRIPPQGIDSLVNLSRAGRRHLYGEAERCGISPRSIHNVLRVARTVADMAGDDRVDAEHVQEAFCYRQPERKTGGL